jgi:hypothetical protein
VSSALSRVILPSHWAPGFTSTKTAFKRGPSSALFVELLNAIRNRILDFALAIWKEAPMAGDAETDRTGGDQTHDHDQGRPLMSVEIKATRERLHTRKLIEVG